MLSKAQIKLVQSLSLKKKRGELTLFVVEGKKQVAELLTGTFEIDSLFATQQWFDEYGNQVNTYIKTAIVSDDELKKISQQQTPQHVLAVVKMPGKFLAEQLNHELIAAINTGFSVFLDGIQDPGNLGTIIRIADWYGIKNIICSNDCVDVFNPKTIQATMGSFMRVDVYYSALETVLEQVTLPVYGALMHGESLHETAIETKGVLLIGSEGKGISGNLMKFITKPVTIPRFGEAESLNAGIATAIICDAWARAK